MNLDLQPLMISPKKEFQGKTCNLQAKNKVLVPRK